MRLIKGSALLALLLLFLLLLLLPHPAAPINPVNRPKKMRMCGLLLMALLQIGSGDKLSSLFAEGAAYEPFPWPTFSRRDNPLGCSLVM
ncbi:hypothetical protein [Yersinia pseudotuberculosis]|uniref:Uncharacterized protein n=1 Tax=Yersinia pseudotuberculosis serotype O:3 (strain YPIII) TaxID=502800 RepID=A0A0H3B1H8_YERPY|nr:hypothetical protein [Yersinia pseudotuberculosis]AJJ59877.1 hypothetical protein BZ22_1276 [Yersinia pseudotuberculosis YPIII]